MMKAKFISDLTTAVTTIAGSLFAQKKQVKVLSTDVSSTSTTRATISDFTVTLEAGKRYKLEFFGLYTSASITTGGSMGFTGTATPYGVLGFMEADISPTAGANGFKMPIQSITTHVMTTTGVGSLSSTCSWYFNFIVPIATTGTFSIQWGSEVSGSSAILAQNSTLIVEEI